MTKPADQIAKARRISEIAEREKKATKGPWFFESHGDPQIEILVSGDVSDEECESRHAPVLMRGHELGGAEIEANWEFVEHARADIPFLLSELASERQAVIEDCAKKLDSMAAKANEIGNNIFETQWIRDCNIVKASILTEAARAIRSME